MIQIRTRPYDINWSGNQIIYSFYSQDAVNDKDIVFEVKLFFKNFTAGAEFAQVCIIPLTPVEGSASIDVGELLRTQLELFLPNISTDPTTSDKQSGIFYVQYRQYNINTNAEEGWVNSEQEYQRIVIKGGIAPFLWKANNYWVNYHPDKKPFLTWQKRGRMASTNERIFLTWFNLTDINVGKIVCIINCTYTDGSTIQKTVILPVTKYSIIHIPVGATERGIINADKTIWYWDVAVYDKTIDNAPALISEVFRYVNDQRNDYNQLTLYYHNSLGGFDPVRIRGVIEATVTLDGSDAESIEPFSENDLSLPRLDRSLPHRELTSFKGDVGHLDKTEQDRLRDAFISREVWMERYGRWWPVKLITRQYALRSSRDKRFSMQIEWMLADAGSYHYTPEMNLGDGALSSNVCTATIQNVQHTLTYFAGNTAATAKLTFEVYDPAGENIKKVQYRVPGIIEEWTDFAYPYLNPLELNFASPSRQTIYLRAICQEGSAGPVKIYSINIAEVGAPEVVNNSNIYNDSNVDTPYSLIADGQTITGGSIGDKSYVSFKINPGVYSMIELNLGFLAPVQGTLTQNSDEVIALGSINGSKITWKNVTVDKLGIIINYH